MDVLQILMMPHHTYYIKGDSTISVNETVI